MTPSQGSRPVVRKSAVLIRDGGKARELVVTVYPEFITLRLLGTRREEVVHLESAYFGAIKARVFKDKMERAKTTKARAELFKPRRR